MNNNDERQYIMTQPTLESFFSGSGGKSVSWKDKPIGTTVSGTILAVHPPQQVTDPATKELKFKKDKVTPIMQVRIDLATNERDPADPDDDGTRSLYVGGWMTGAVGDALRKAGRQGPPEIGAQIAVMLSERTPNENPALAPINKFVANYQSPASAATGQFFAQQQAPAQPPVQAPQFQAPVAPPPQQTVMQAPAAPAMPVPQFQAPVPQPAPVPAAVGAIVAKPDAIAQSAWDLMDDATKASVAATMAQLPPF